MDRLRVIKHTIGFVFFAGVVANGWAQSSETGPLVEPEGKRQPAENTRMADDILLQVSANLEAGVHTIKAANAAKKTTEDTFSFIIVEPSAADLADAQANSDFVYLAER
ncbi:hypothetical protein HBA55_30130 [Pseudomaricurvus alkylphenolicus]|jgi:hypothetical protein|uniref:hypothetical protein n=1 Tax=Pseudomaricurvus alkylphenolicus TaxID=1306991 RepID=UPI00141F9447|nr:hypothetical protein [Pseudomaricurvus alkylphenolicus]NIB43899.1 hypothetical protein [Pseudomaricurvus alkylphenolicus]